MRRATVAFAKAHDAGPELLDDIALATSELVTNAVKQHADVPELERVVDLSASTARRDGSRSASATVDVVSEPKARDGLGMGLMIVASLVDYLTICQEGEGTEVWMRFLLRSR